MRRESWNMFNSERLAANYEPGFSFIAESLNIAVQIDILARVLRYLHLPFQPLKNFLAWYRILESIEPFTYDPGLFTWYNDRLFDI